MCWFAIHVNNKKPRGLWHSWKNIFLQFLEGMMTLFYFLGNYWSDKPKIKLQRLSSDFEQFFLVKNNLVYF